MFSTLIRRLFACALFCICIAAVMPVQAQLLLNEMMASNASTLEDQFGEYPDWIEIFNSGSQPVQLNDYWLSDDINELNKWRFPEMDLPGNSYLVVCASGMNLSTPLSYWHTVINTGEQWRYHIPDQAISDSWKESTQTTSLWNEGIAGFGFSDGDDSTEIAKTISLYIQKEFEIQRLEDITDAALYMDYDDGFIAYLNGVEIARSANMGDSGRVVAFDAPAGDNHEANMYQGLPPEAFYFSNDIDLLKQGSNILAIEVHNVSTSSSDLTANPFLLLGYNTLLEDKIYKNPYFPIKDVFPHSNFKIKSGGETIYISNEEGLIIDTIKNTILPTDFSYGRIVGSENEFAYFSEASPGELNAQDYLLDYFTDSVRILPVYRDFDDSYRVYLESNNEDDRIHYTKDGSEPNENSLFSWGFIDIDETTIIKARIYREKSLPGPVTTRTIFHGSHHDLPVISVTMDPYDLWDYNNGIYEMGPNAQENNPHMGANFWQDWERKAHIEIFDTLQNLRLSQDAGVKIFGGWSRAHPQKSMSFFARSDYGKGSFSCKLFSEKPIEEFEAFVLRNNGNDWCNGMFRDAISAYMANLMEVDHQAYEPYVMYLNGEYWGIINMREKINEHFIASNHHVYSEDVNILTGNGHLVHGSPDSYLDMYDFVSSNNMADEDNYQKAMKMLDARNLISFWALNVYVDNKDWPGNNNKFWSTTAPGSLYKWISYDTDFGYSIWNQRAYQVNTLKFSFSEGEITWANQEWATAVVRSLLENSSFRNQFINEFADRMNTTFHPDNMIPVVDSFEQRIINEAPAHYDRWTKDQNSWLNYPNWLTSVERIRTYFHERPFYMRTHLMEHFNIADTFNIQLNISDSQAGYIRLNSMNLEDFPFSGTYFEDIPINMLAVPAPGFRFSHWTGDYESDDPQFTFDMGVPASFTAVFEAVDSVTDIVINEINYTTGSESYSNDWIELYNNSGVAVDLSGWSVSDGFSGDTFYIPAGTILRENGYHVISRSRENYKRVYPEHKFVSGNFPFGLSAEGDGVALYDSEENIHDFVIYGVTNPWPTLIEGQGMIIELIHPSLDNTLGENWKSSMEETGTPFAQNSVFEKPLNVQETIELQMPETKIYPNPFSHDLEICMTLTEVQNMEVEVFTITGQKIALISRGEFSPGEHVLTWTPNTDIQAGIYLVKVKSANTQQILKVIYR